MKTLITLCVVLLSTASFSQIYFSDDFQATPGVLDGGWTVIDADGLTVNASVAQFTSAWISAGDFDNPGDEVAMSTSWYDPAGTSSDWLISPQITLLPNSTISWDEEAQDLNYPDGYELRISTTGPTIAGFNANPALMTVAAANGAAWLYQTVDLQAAGYSSGNVHFAWHNNSTDQFVLMIDSVVVQAAVAGTGDVSMTADMGEYTQIPLTQITAIGTTGTIDNVGTSAVTNATMTVNVYDGGMSNVYTASSTPANLAIGANTVATVAGYTPALADVYTVEQIASITEIDALATNDTSYYTVIVDTAYARDDGVQVGTLGIGPLTPGTLGQQYDIVNTDDITSVTFRIGNAAGTMTGQPVVMSIWDMVAGEPNAIVAQTVPLTILDAVDSTYNMALSAGPFSATAGSTYMVSVEEGDSNTVIGYSNGIFTLGTTWVTFPGAPVLPWANNEDYGFNVTYIIRPIFGSTGGCVNSVSTLNESSCGDYTAPSGVVLTTTGMFTDVIPNACGADSTITINLVILTPDLSVTEAGGVLTSGAGVPATYQWIDCATLSDIAGATGQSYTPTVTGSYAVIVDNLGCADTSACTTVTVGGLNDFAANGGVEVYPNPSNGTFNVSVVGVTTNAMNIEVLDMTGRIIETRTFDNVQGQLTTSISLDVEEGAYLVRISANGETAVQSVVISRK